MRLCLQGRVQVADQQSGPENVCQLAWFCHILNKHKTRSRFSLWFVSEEQAFRTLQQCNCFSLTQAHDTFAAINY